MVKRHLFTIACLLAATTGATRQLLATDVLHTPYTALVSEAPLLFRRQDDGGGDDGSNSTDPLANPDGTLNMTAWNEATDTACRSQLASLPRGPSNPSGHSICFNLPSLDATRGIFEADLRLYRVADPRGDFVDMDSEQVDVGVSFAAADVDRINETTVMGVGMVGEIADLLKRQSLGDPEDIELMQSYLIIGKIREDKMSDDMNMADLEALLLPSLTLTANTTDTSADPLRTTLSPNEASFLTGVFSNTSVLSDFAAAQAAVDRRRAEFDADEAAFILPGTQFMVFPIGFIITSVWTALGVAAYGWGTLERYKFKKSFEERKRIMASSRAARAPY